MTKAAPKPFLGYMRDTGVRLSADRFTAYLNSGLSPFDCLVYIRNHNRALARAMQSNDTKAGCFLSSQREQLTFADTEAQAKVDELPRSEQINLYHEQIDRLESRRTTGHVPAKEYQAFSEELEYYRDRLNRALGTVSTVAETQICVGISEQSIPVDS